jgi:hypothetical protein
MLWVKRLSKIKNEMPINMKQYSKIHGHGLRISDE